MIRPDEKTTFLICPVRGANQEIASTSVKELEKEGWVVHFPPRDTDQDDDTGLRICEDNRAAIAAAGCVHFIWDGKSQGCLFDLGIAFQMRKRIIPIAMPAKTPHKSFQNMVVEWSEIGAPNA